MLRYLLRGSACRIGLFLVFLWGGAPLWAATSVSQHGITWKFDRDYQVGQYANGDYWVVGPVTITSITPASTNSGGWIKNGTQVNPEVGERQGYDSSTAYTSYDPALNVSPNITGRPLYVTTGSVVSTVSKSTANNRPQLQKGAILTVVASPPAPGSFRPAPVGTDKRSIATVHDLDYSILRSLPRVADTPPLHTVSAWFEKPWFEQNPNWTGRYIHPVDNQPAYGREIARYVGRALLSLHLDYSNEEKRELFIRLVQYGLDIYGAAKHGAVWEDLGGHNHGRKMPMLLAGLALGNADILRYADASQHFIFQDDRQIWYVTQSDVGRKLYNKDGRRREEYRQEDVGMPEWGAQHARNPDRDGRNWDVTYRDIVGSSNIGQILAAHLTRGAVERWNHPATFDYYDRFWEIEKSRVGTHTNAIPHFEANMWSAYRKLGGSPYQGDPTNPGENPPDQGEEPGPKPVPVAGWENIPLSGTDGTFTLRFDITPTSSPVDVVVGISSGSADHVVDLGPIFRLAPSGMIDARNGSDYDADSALAYTSGTTYKVEMTVSMATRRYAVRVSVPGGGSFQIADGFAFRTEQAKVSSPNNLGVYAFKGGYTISNISVEKNNIRPMPPTLIRVD